MEADYSSDDDSVISDSSNDDDDDNDDFVCSEVNENNIKMPNTRGITNKQGKQLIQAMVEDNVSVPEDLLNERSITNNQQNKT